MHQLNPFQQIPLSQTSKIKSFVSIKDISLAHSSFQQEKSLPLIRVIFWNIAHPSESAEGSPESGAIHVLTEVIEDVTKQSQVWGEWLTTPQKLCTDTVPSNVTAVTPPHPPRASRWLADIYSLNSDNIWSLTSLGVASSLNGLKTRLLSICFFLKLKF